MSITAGIIIIVVVSMFFGSGLRSCVEGGQSEISCEKIAQILEIKTMEAQGSCYTVKDGELVIVELPRNE